MNLSQFLLILKARYRIILTVILLVFLFAFLLSWLLPKKYASTTSLVLNYKGQDPVTGVVLPAQLMPGYMATQIDVITSRKVAVKVVDDLGITESPAAQEQFAEAKGLGNIRDWFADRLLASLDVKPSKDSSVIDITFEGSDPVFAAQVVNSFANAYLKTNVELKAEPAQRAAGFLGEQSKLLRKSLQDAQAKLSKYQKEKEITGFMGNLDVESARLNDLSSQYVRAQADAYDAESREKNSHSLNSSPDVATNPVVQNLKIQLSTADSNLSELAQRYGANHPQYLAAKSEADKLRSLLNQEANSTSNRIGTTANIYAQREKDLKDALVAQKNRVLQLNLTRNELSVLVRDVENAQRALDAASMRHTQATLEGNSNQSDVAILNEATPSDKPKSPNLTLNLLLASFLGPLIAVSLAMLLEMLNRKVRSKEDIAELLEVPVFAIIDNSKTNTKLLGNTAKLIGYSGH